MTQGGGILRLRPMRAADLAAVAAVETSMQHPWPPALLAAELDRGHGWQMVGEIDDRLCCYATGTLVADEAEIHRLVVAADLRRWGIGGALLSAVLDMLTTRGGRYCYIEVRASNTPALRLYRQTGFRPVGRRRNYYRDPQEDALLLAADLPVVLPFGPASGKYATIQPPARDGRHLPGSWPWDRQLVTCHLAARKEEGIREEHPRHRYQRQEAAHPG